MQHVGGRSWELPRSLNCFLHGIASSLSPRELRVLLGFAVVCGAKVAAQMDGS